MTNETLLSEKDLQVHIDSRNNAPKLLAANANYFGTAADSKLKPVFPVGYFNGFEEISCVGYHPVLEELTATIKIKQASGYGGNLCTKGSVEYVRFFLDYGDGIWHDMGMTGVNVHDIPTGNDCAGAAEKPLTYVVRLNIGPKQFLCSKPNLPKIKAILSWNVPLPVGVPNPAVIWGDHKEVHVQIEPLHLLKPEFPIGEVGALLSKAIQNPEVSLSGIASTIPGGAAQLQSAQAAISPDVVEFTDLAKQYAQAKINVEPERIGTSILAQTVHVKNPAASASDKMLFTNAGLNFEAAVEKFLALSGNTSYEELFCVGADYAKNALVGTLRVKKSAGYNGGLCGNGSHENVAFWIQTQPGCKWEYAGTAFVNVYDIPLTPDGLSYSVILPFDLSKFKKDCGSPVVLKVRGVLSWSALPSTTNPDAVPYWGNIIDAYVQVAPGEAVVNTSRPIINTIGGVSIDNIDNASAINSGTYGCTLPGTTIEINQTPVIPGSPFGGIIVIQGITDPFAGLHYRIQVTNLNNGTTGFLKNAFTVLGYNPVTNKNIHNTITPDADGWYEYQTILNNLDMVLANFTPGTNDLLQITLQMKENGGNSVTKTIQMDNSQIVWDITTGLPTCNGYKKGDHISGTFTASQKYLVSYTLDSNLAPGHPVDHGTAGVTSKAFGFDTAAATTPCGSIGLDIQVKTIINSVQPGYSIDPGVVVCLK